MQSGDLAKPLRGGQRCFAGDGERRAVTSAEALHLSETIDIAILDLWYTNRDAHEAAGSALAPEAFAGMFVEEYSKDGSRADVWPGDASSRARPMGLPPVGEQG